MPGKEKFSAEQESTTPEMERAEALDALRRKVDEDEHFSEYLFEMRGKKISEVNSMGAEELAETVERFEDLRGRSELGVMRAEIDANEDFAEFCFDFRSLTPSEINGADELARMKLVEAYEEYEQIDAQMVREKLDADPEFFEFVEQKWHVNKGREPLAISEINTMSRLELAELLEDYESDSSDESESLAPPELLGDEEKIAEVAQEQEEGREAIVAADLDTTLDVDEMARQLAHERHEEFLSEKKGLRGAMRRMVFGNLFKEAHLVHEERLAREEIEAQYEEGKFDKAGLERFVKAFGMRAEDMLIHDEAGEKYSAYSVLTDDEGKEYVERRYKASDGAMKTERLPEGDEMAQQTLGLRDLIEKYAKQEGKFDRAEFRDEVEKLRRSEMVDDRALSIDNYAEIVEGLKDFQGHEDGLKNALEGFTYVNGEARRNVRTQEHRDALDKITQMVMKSKMRFVPPELVAVGAGAAYAMVKSTVTTTGRAVAPLVGGAAASSLFAGAKERSRVNYERSVAARRKAQGESAGDSKYDRQMWESLQSMQSAGALTGGLTEQLGIIKAENVSEAEREYALKALLLNFANTEAAIGVSDRTGNDLISYSSGENAVVEQERLAMDIARATAKKALFDNAEVLTGSPGNENNEEALRRMIASATKQREEELLGERENDEDEVSLSAADEAFKKLRRKRVASRMAKTAGMTVMSGLALQEARAMFSDDLHGIVDHLRGHEDNPSTSATFLAGKLGFENPSAGELIVDGQELSEERIRELEEQGAVRTDLRYEEVEREATLTATENHVEHGTDMMVRRDWRDEASIMMQVNGGDVYATADSDVQLLATVNGQKYLLDGTRVNGELHFGEALEKAGLAETVEAGGYDYLEFVSDNGAGADGLHDLDVYSTVVGNGSGFEAAESTVSETVAKYSYEMPVTEVEMPSVAIPVTGREGLTRGETGNEVASGPSVAEASELNAIYENGGVVPLTEATAEGSLTEMLPRLTENAREYFARINGDDEASIAQNMQNMEAALSMWDNQVDVEAKRRILRGENPDRVLGPGWWRWINAFAGIGLIEVKRG